MSETESKEIQTEETIVTETESTTAHDELVMDMFEKIQKSFSKANKKKGIFGINVGFTKPSLDKRKKDRNRNKKLIKKTKQMNRVKNK